MDRRPPTKPVTPDARRAAAALLAVLCAAVGVTCATEGQLRTANVLAPAASERAPTTATAMASSAESAAVELAAPSGAISVETAPAPRPRLQHFCGALKELSRQSRDQHVRVLWYGDSHTYADFLTHAVRSPLQRRYGNGGPGFVHLGLSPYRHGGVKASRSGPWRQEPAAPSRSTRFSDGVLGLGGIRTVPESAAASATVELNRGAVEERAEWQLWYRFPERAAALTVQVDDGEPRSLSGASSAGSKIQRATFEGTVAGRFLVRGAAGAPQLFGAAVESGRPGVVLDTLGINGARAATPLAWDDQSFLSLFAARQPDLVVLAYGTNEVFATEDPERYHEHFDRLLERLRRSNVRFDCLLVGPTDVAAPGGASHSRVASIDQVERAASERLGCAYFSIYQAMGGEGAAARWAAEHPPLAAKDGVHLTPRGYEDIGARIADVLLAACE